MEGGGFASTTMRPVAAACRRLTELHGVLAGGAGQHAVAAEAAEALEMSDTEKFMFDLQGYIVVPDFLSQNEVDRLNAAFDGNWDLRRRGSEATKRSAYDQFYGMLEWPAPHCEPFRELAGLLTQGVPGVPGDPLAPPSGPWASSRDSLNPTGNPPGTL
jgi:hypothetical protein